MAAMEKGTIPPDDEFLQHIKEKTRKSKYFFYDFWRASIMEYEGKPCLIDLESVYPICEYDFRKKQNKDVYEQKDHLIKNPDYRKFVEKLYKDIWKGTFVQSVRRACWLGPKRLCVAGNVSWC